MCGGCSSDNNQTNMMTFQDLVVGMSSLGVAAGVAPCRIDDFERWQ
jgi:hypothetical protein